MQNVWPVKKGSEAAIGWVSAQRNRHRLHQRPVGPHLEGSATALKHIMHPAIANIGNGKNGPILWRDRTVREEFGIGLTTSRVESVRGKEFRVDPGILKEEIVGLYVARTPAPPQGHSEIMPRR